MRWARLARKLYCVVAGSLFIVAMLVAAAIHIGLVTREAVEDVESKGVTGFVESIHIEEQLVQHRRLLETIVRAENKSGSERRALAELDAAILNQIERAEGLLQPNLRRLITLVIEQGGKVRRLVEGQTGPALISDLATAYETYSEGVTILFREQDAQRASYMVTGLRRLGNNAQLLIL